MNGKTANKKIVMLACFLLLTSIAGAGSEQMLVGKVSYQDRSPAPGVVVYALDSRHCLEVRNNNIMMAEHLLRAISDVQGRFTLPYSAIEGTWLFARDMEDNCVFMRAPTNNRGSAEIIILEPATVKGQLLKGDTPVKGQEVSALFFAQPSPLRYFHTVITDKNGVFEFDQLMPGEYLFQVIQEVPQVGCCFRSVVTKQLRMVLEPGEKKEVKLGGTDLPFLSGKISDTEGNGLHGVWVHLEPEDKSKKRDVAESDSPVAWSDVTRRDGSYEIFDIPPGKYTLHCFRRLARNNYRRTLQENKSVFIAVGEQIENSPARSENVCDVAIDMEAFRPLKYGQAAPQLSGTLLSGEKFSLGQHHGKIVVLHFYATWCTLCVASFNSFEQLHLDFDADKVLVLGISLDKEMGDCQKFISKKGFHHPQLFAGGWAESSIRKAFRVADVPTTFVIDREGKIAQIDLFDATLKKFIQDLLKSD